MGGLTEQGTGKNGDRVNRRSEGGHFFFKKRGRNKRIDKHEGSFTERSLRKFTLIAIVFPEKEANPSVRVKRNVMWTLGGNSAH